MKHLVSIALAGLLLGLGTAGCASNGGGSHGASAAGGSGITVFGTIDASVSGTRNTSSK